MPIHRRFGFTLIEVLLTLILGGALSVAVIETLSTIIRLDARMANRSLALERGWYVLSVLEPRALHASLGLTFSPSDSLFQRSFGGGTGTFPPPGGLGWEHGPLRIWRDNLHSADEDDDGVFRGRGFSVLYSVPSGLRADIPAVIELSDGLLDVEVRGDASQLDVRLPATSKKDIRSWAVFPLSRLPVHISSHIAGSHSSSLKIQLASAMSTYIYPYDELHYLRGERFFAENAQLYAQTLTTAWQSQGEAMLEGVLEMWFEWTPSLHRLEAWILTTGGQSGVKTPRHSDWPAAAPWKADFERQDTAVVFGSWILKNL
ncbi:hypothetical protein AGMMS50276_03200 [Synergistales bacterium]|nr:hypothetical protein AGMMS50276_03200 [Synergistales bacterium]